MTTTAPASPDTLAEQIKRRAASDARGPFPRDECQRLVSNAKPGYKNLVPDMDAYFYDVWSAANGVHRLSRQTDEQLVTMRASFALSFFDRFPEYRPFAAHISPDETPQLSARLALFDALRSDLTQFITALLDARRTNGNGTRLPSPCP